MVTTLRIFHELSYRYLTGIVIVLALVLQTSSAYANTLQASVDKRSMEEGESFVLTLRVINPQRGSKLDISPLEQDFEVLRTQQNTSMQINNGEVSRTAQFDLELMAKRSGSLTIPSLIVAGERSPEIEIEVRVPDASGGTGQGLTETETTFVRFYADKTEAYIREQILLTVELYTRHQLVDGNLSKPEHPELIVETANEGSKSTVEIDGYRYSMLKREYVVFPQSSGTITLDPIQFNGVISQGNRLGFSIGSSQLKRLIKRSPSIALNIKSIPSNYPNAPWLPAKELRLSDEWPADIDTAVAAGTPVTRTLVVDAIGLPSSLLPELPLAQSDRLRSYPDQPVLSDAFSKGDWYSQHKVAHAMIPSEAGPLTMPAMKIYWWNTETDTLEEATAPAKVVSVAADPTVDTPKDSPVADSINSTIPSASSELSHSNEKEEIDQRPESSSLTPKTTESEVSDTQDTPYFWLSIVIVLSAAWAVTLLVLFWVLAKRKRTSKETSGAAKDLRANNVVQLKQIEKALKHACHVNKPEMARPALIDALSIKLAKQSDQITDGAPNTPNNLVELQNATSGTPLYGEIRALEKALYGGVASNWDGPRLWEAYKQYELKPESKESEALSLYPV